MHDLPPETAAEKPLVDTRTPAPSDLASRTLPDVPSAALPADPDTSDRGVASLLAVAAMVAAWVTFVAVNASGGAGSSWQTALRQEVARGAGAVEAIRYVYGVEAPAAFRVATEEVVEAVAREAAASAEPSIAAALDQQAQVAGQVVGILRQAAEMAGPEYALADGGYDPVRRLADSLAANVALPDAPVRDPEARLAEGDLEAALALRLMGAIVVISFAFLFGALAQAWRAWRRPLLWCGWIALLSGGVLAISGGMLG